MIRLMGQKYTIDLGYTAEQFAALQVAKTYKDIRLPGALGVLGLVDVRMGDPDLGLPDAIIYHPDGFPKGSSVGTETLINPTTGGVMVLDTCTRGLIEQGYVNEPNMKLYVATWRCALDVVSRLPIET